MDGNDVREALEPLIEAVERASEELGQNLAELSTPTELWAASLRSNHRAEALEAALDDFVPVSRYFIGAARRLRTKMERREEKADALADEAEAKLADEAEAKLAEAEKEIR